ncbi:MAG: beta-galactosidase, partial [Clostridia bacterium]|nr:beta-galactosidase [Clostridia bacterium]
DEPADTFLRTDGFRKGFVLLNGFNLGRFWEIGPQKTLYVPRSLLCPGDNEVIVFTSDGLSGDAAVTFTDTPDLG